MKVTIDLTKTIEQNADEYFSQAKKARRKIKGLDVAMANFTEKEVEDKTQVIQKRRKLEWYEKYRWFISRDGFLVIGGRDATTNEVIIKKHTQSGDLVLHTDMAGSPFVVIKEDGRDIPNSTIEEAAQFTASMSRAWKKGLGELDVFYVTPEQVSKEAQAGESLPKGAFMIRGETKYLRPEVGLACCEKEGKFMVAPKSACGENSLELVQGKTKASDAAKQIKRLLALDEDLDTIIRCLPPGEVDVKQQTNQTKR